MKTLKFLGIESGFGINNTSAYTIENNNLVLIDCGGTTFGKLLKMDNDTGFLKKKDNIGIIITHLHDDHVGSLGTLLCYCKYILNKKPIIYTKCENIKERLLLGGYKEDLYEIKESNNIEFIKTIHDENLDCYGFKMTINEKKIIYTGDTSTFAPFATKLDGVSEIYVDTNLRKNNVHINLLDYLDYFKELVNLGLDVYLMHLDDIDKTKELIQDTGILLANEDKLYKEDIIRILKEYNLDSNRYVVITGAALVLNGLKEHTKDIDISVTSDYYRELLSKYNCSLEKVNEEGECIFYIDDIIKFGHIYYRKEKNCIDGIPTFSKEKIIDLLKKGKEKKFLK